ncbi:MAG TPA: AEC family transporter, partial [Nitratifractor sp.]|nr:AEC family transporter [Nitratifractor sp.]
VILSLYSSKRATPKEIILKIVTFPSFLALLFTLLGLARYLPLWSFDILKMLASTLTPAALLAIGLLLNFTLPKGKRIAFIFALTLKLLIAPLLLYALFALLGLHSLVAKVTLFEAAMAPMVSSSMLAIMANLEKRFVASTLGVGIIVSFVTLPLFYLLIETL